ncbi:aminotransferase class III-fold pyridoxal phosphate-dependent enzyme [Streptomyces sp. DH41]|uniref:aminotransferase class III-fold pyridoxal phosphate-dependent enzyme n=1 Tax=Streptomyces sp. DH41 TaxID=3040125 RepID=UPI002441AA35|nr:aminotransferase class III-fold pyridoxal phosphate-dependent enzyme [Streptomyces sp. DH41]MDG9726893.1 aminotransferase class III-fold pyridoxal phosphate-dependent enzyme [Streptomyces sp. DH41]
MAQKSAQKEAQESAPKTAQESAPKRQTAREPSARTYARALPVVPVRARGLTIEGADGRRYLDCVSGAGTLVLGHNHPVVLKAIREVLDSGAPLQVMDLTTPVEDAFVTELLRTLPPGLAHHARVRFCGPAGTDPLATAGRLVRAATGRARVIAFTDAHHRTTAEACAGHSATRDEPLARLPYPQDRHCPFGVGGERGAELAAHWAESVLDDRRSGEELPAGVILEPVRSESGVLPVPDAWTRRMRRITAERSVPLIADETETGVGRTGAFWAVEHSGVVPDVLVLSKAIGGSLPLAAVVHRDDLHTGEPGTGTFRGNQLALAAGAATLAHVREHRLAEHAAALGSRILARLRGLAEEFECVGDVRGRGLMIGVELTAPDRTRDAPANGVRPGTAAELAAAVQRECLRRGLIVDVTGPSANVVRLLPPLIVTEEQTTAVLDRLADAVETVDRSRGDHAPPRGVCAAL